MYRASVSTPDLTENTMYMYKRFHIFALIALAFVSCSKETPVSETEVRFCATIQPEVTVLLKSGEAETEPILTDHAVLEIWRDDRRVARQEKSVPTGSTEISFESEKLAGGVDYDVLIWVDKKGYYTSTDLHSVSLNNKSYNGTDPDFDAFFVHSPFNGIQGNEVCPVTLTRPFAKLNFSAPVNKDVLIAFRAPTVFNLKTGETSGNKSFEYTVHPTDSEVNAFDFVFAGLEVTYLDYAFKIGQEDAKTTSVPVARNKKTNIIYKVTN